MSKKKITVTKKDISKSIKLISGEEDFPQACPIALAAKRAFGVEKIEVNTETIKIKGIKRIKLPEPAQNFIERFDNSFDSSTGTADAEPFSFYVEYAPSVPRTTR